MKNNVVKGIFSKAPEVLVETELGKLIARPSGDPKFQGITIYLQPKNGEPEITLSTTEFVADGSNVSTDGLIPMDRVLPEMQDKVSESDSADFGVANCFMQTTPGFQTCVYEDGYPTDEPPARHLHYHIPGSIDVRLSDRQRSEPNRRNENFSGTPCCKQQGECEKDAQRCCTQW